MGAYFSSDMIVKYLVVIFAYVWGGVEIFHQIRQRKRNRNAPDDHGSLILLYVCITLGYSIGVPISFSPYGRIYWGQPYWLGFGVLLIVSGLWIRISAMRTLGAYFTYEVGIQTQHALVEKGLYRYIRHPGYLGQLLVFLGIGLALMNWMTVLGLCVPIFIAFSRRINVEECVLQAHLGERYEAYRQRSWRLLPGLY
jgi:protein-S-isoprenylcysteine O-methyltransferase Ste14